MRVFLNPQIFQTGLLGFDRLEDQPFPFHLQHGRGEMTRSDLHKGFPFAAKLDLSPLVGLWREQAADSESL